MIISELIVKWLLFQTDKVKVALKSVWCCSHVEDKYTHVTHDYISTRLTHYICKPYTKHRIYQYQGTTRNKDVLSFFQINEFRQF